MLAVAVVGLVANAVAMWLLSSAQRRSINVRGAYLEVLGDLIGSAAVIVAAVVIVTTGWVQADAIASLFIAGGLTYLIITWLSSAEGYRLSLAGVTGLIISIGLIADSFIVYFERVRDELRDGRALTSAVEAGWRRAWRTIVASKALNLLAGILLERQP